MSKIGRAFGIVAIIGICFAPMVMATTSDLLEMEATTEEYEGSVFGWAGGILAVIGVGLVLTGIFGSHTGVLVSGGVFVFAAFLVGYGIPNIRDEAMSGAAEVEHVYVIEPVVTEEGI